MDVICGNDSRRLVLEHDPYAEPPYDDGSFPVLIHYYDGARSSSAQETRITGFEVHPRLIDAWQKWHGDSHLFERYARAFHGVSSFAYRSTRDAEFVALDPQAWREEMGITGPLDDGYSRDMLGEYGAYLDGESYVASVQETCDHGAWHTVDSLTGLYGDYAETAAREWWAELTEMRVSLCADCVYLDANGWDEKETGEPLPDPVPMSQLAGHLIGPAPCACSPRVEDCEACRDPHFGTAPCDGCGQSLAGNRFDYVAVLA